MALTRVKGSVWSSDDNYLTVNVKDFGAKGDGVTDDTAAIQAAVDSAEASGSGFVRIGGGVFNVSTLKITSCVLVGAGGHTSKTTIVGTSTSGNVITIEGRSSGIIGVRVDATPSRRSGGSSTIGGVLVSRGDIEKAAISRTTIKDVYITNQPGFGLYAVSNIELCVYENITSESCLGHALIMDDGTFAGHVNKQERPFNVRVTGFRAYFCGGNTLIGNTGQTSLGYGLTFNQLESLDCAWNSATRQGLEQVIVRAQNVTFNFPDIENQAYASSVDNLGNPKTPLATPVKGFFVAAKQVKIFKPYTSSLLQSCFFDTSLSDCCVEDPVIFTGTYGIPQSVAYEVPSSMVGFRFVGANQSGATTLLKNQSAGAFIYIDGIQLYGITLSTKDWDVSHNPKAATISAGVLEISSCKVDVNGEGGVADDLSTLRLASGNNGREAIDCYLLNRNAYTITVKHGTGNLITKTGADVSLTSSVFVLHFIYNSTDSKWYQV